MEVSDSSIIEDIQLTFGRLVVLSVPEIQVTVNTLYHRYNIDVVCSNGDKNKSIYQDK